MLTGKLVIGLVALSLLGGVETSVQTCASEATVSADQRARREAAIRFLQRVHSAQIVARAERGAYASLADVTRGADLPVGFVPRLTVDQWSYVISLKDLFDPCGFSLFSDQAGTIYEAWPAVRDRPPDAAAESEA